MDHELSQVILGIMSTFPTYDLQAKQGVGEAIDDIESRLSVVATFKYVSNRNLYCLARNVIFAFSSLFYEKSDFT
jgi:hypothetical protein